MKTLHIAVSGSYDILIGAPLNGCGAAIREAASKAELAVIVTDSNVGPLYLETVQASLQAAGFRTAAITIPAGEPSKSAGEYLRILDFLASQEVTRTDLLVALGGGVVGDLTGFAAATYLRGTRFVQIPTSLLAMVDSSVGGKTAIDISAGKNLVGAFHQPSLVYIDTAVLSTLPERQFNAGCGEVIKYGILQDPEIMTLMEQGAAANLDEIIYRSLVVKADLVTQDERDTGARQFLNLGHTVGHAVEQHCGYELLHGECVAIGMMVITKAAVANGICDPAVLPRLQAALEQYDLPLAAPVAADTLMPYLRNDKKRRGGSVTLVVPESMGFCRLRKTPLDQLAGWLQPGFEV